MNAICNKVYSEVSVTNHLLNTYNFQLAPKSIDPFRNEITDTHTHVNALFIRVRNRKQHTCFSTEECIRKLWYILTV